MLKSPSKMLVKEWAKFRYGVFDDHGYPGDEMYPNFYKVQGKFLPTGTSNTLVMGSWMTLDGEAECSDPGLGDCQFVAQGENDEVTCSLGFIPQLARVNTWCSLDQIKVPTAPTKQNILCNSRPAAQIISEHADFASSNRVDKLQTVLQPTFHIVRDPSPKHVLLIETSSEMVETWKWTRKAVQNLVKYQLPRGSQVAIVTFNSDARIESGLVTLDTDTDRAGVADNVPDSANKLGSTSRACVTCAIQLSTGRLLNGASSGVNLIIVTSGADHTEHYVTSDMLDNVHVSVINTGNKIESSDKLRDLTEETGGLYRQVTSVNEMEMYTQMIGYLGDVISQDPQRGHVYPVTLHQRHVESGTGSSTFGTFVLDSDLGRDTEFGIYVEDDEDHQIKSVTFSDSQSNIYGPFTSMSSFYDSVNLKTINFNVGETPPWDREPGSEWSYNIDWYRSKVTRDNIVLVTSKPRSEERIMVKSWTNLNMTDNIIDADNLMAVFVQVKL